MTIRLAYLSLPLFTVACLAGCTPQRMSAPPDVVKASKELPITNRSAWSGMGKEEFGIGDYKVQDVDRKWTRTKGAGIGGFSKQSTSGGYSFALAGQGPALRGTCETASAEKSVGLPGGVSLSKQQQRVSCSCDQASVVLEAKNKKYGGTLKTSQGSYQLGAIYEREAGPRSTSPTGYRVDGEGPIGAVDVLNPGRVWVSTAVPDTERKELACIFAGLMLYRPPT